MNLAISISELSELIEQIYQGALTGDWDAALNQLMEFTQSNKALFVLNKNSETKPLTLEYRANFAFPAIAWIDYQARAHEDPSREHVQFLTEGEWVNVNKRQYEDSSYYRDINVPLKVAYGLAGVLCRDTHHESLLMVNRGEEDQPYEASEEALFDIIMPHFSRAMHIYKELRLYKNYSNLTKSIIDQQDKAILVCDENGTIVIQNQFAEQNLLPPSSIYVSNNKICIESPESQNQLEHFIRECSKLAYKSIGSQESIIIEQQDHDQENHDVILITVAPVKDSKQFNNIEVPCCLITVNYQHKINWVNIQNQFSLTQRETQLTQALYFKKKLSVLTSELNVSHNTLKTHLKSIFLKLKVNSQTELLVKLSLFR
ncbi:LuxR C-terminal-related transcriptional regulator [Paraglaciecola marina]|uniref:LuxR C-terminal-related transcriptional regulator n=1 Tax=Paraglaciecola marina TaxID=2500157 RepID=UPI00105EFE40|nr:LuxR C-terminal-related transcriptional regulator [Paraglaciecola marina]